MNEPHPTLYGLEIEGESEALVRELAKGQVKVLNRNDGIIEIELPAVGTQSVVLDAVRKTGATFRGLHPKRSSLEEMFMAAITRQGSKAAEVAA